MSHAYLRGTDFRDTKGVYKWKGEEYMSVTTAIKVLNKPALVGWGIKTVAEGTLLHWNAFRDQFNELVANRAPGKDLVNCVAESHLVLGDLAVLKGMPYGQRDRKADIGTRLHDIVERFALGTETDPSLLPDDIEPYAKAFLGWANFIQPRFLASECFVLNRKHGYGGTLDAVAEIDGKTYVIDFKTSKGTYPEHCLQLAAYANAEVYCHASPGKAKGDRDGEEYPLDKIDAAMIVLVGPDAGPDGVQCYEWPLVLPDKTPVFDTFVTVLECAKAWQKFDGIVPAVWEKVLL